MKVFIVMLSLLLIGCSKSIFGVYQHRICDEGPNCFYLTLNKDSLFSYEYHQDVLGSGTIKGSYSITNDTLLLFPLKDTAKIHSVLIFDYAEWICKRYLIKAKKLYPLQYEPEMVLFGEETYYKKQ